MRCDCPERVNKTSRTSSGGVKGRWDAATLRDLVGSARSRARDSISPHLTSVFPVWSSDRVGRDSQDRHHQTFHFESEGIYTEGLGIQPRVGWPV